MDNFYGYVLLVDDNTDDLDLAVRSLRKANFPYNVMVAQDGQQAVDILLEKSPPPDRRRLGSPIAIFLGARLPKRDGTDVMRQVQKDKGSIPVPVFMMTAGDDESERMVPLGLGENGFITKPLTYGNIMGALRSIGMQDVPEKPDRRQLSRVKSR